MNLTERLLAELEATPELTPRSTERVLKSLRPTLSDVAPYLTEPLDKPYGRELLFATDAFEVLVMTWAFESACLPHNHGDAFGWVFVVQGVAINELYEREGTGRVRFVRDLVVAEGKLCFAPRFVVHAMRNPSPDTRLITLHVYSPRIERMEVFDVERDCSCIVRDDCGAWWPEDDQMLELRMAPTATEIPEARSQ